VEIGLEVVVRTALVLAVVVMVELPWRAFLWPVLPEFADPHPTGAGKH